MNRGHASSRSSTFLINAALVTAIRLLYPKQQLYRWKFVISVAEAFTVVARAPMHRAQHCGLFPSQFAHRARSQSNPSATSTRRAQICHWDIERRIPSHSDTREPNRRTRYLQNSRASTRNSHARTPLRWSAQFLLRQFSLPIHLQRLPMPRRPLLQSVLQSRHLPPQPLSLIHI